jgi:O-antigen biosynthesis protein
MLFVASDGHPETLVIHLQIGGEDVTEFGIQQKTRLIAHLSGCRVCITVKNKKKSWPVGVKLGFVRVNREPALITRSPNVSNPRAAKLYCWVPKGTVSLQLIVGDEIPYNGNDLSIVSVRRVSLLELGLRVILNSPKKLYSVFRLQIAGNSKGEAFRFARSVDELNALPYRSWLRLHKQAISIGHAEEPIQDVTVLVTIEAGSSSQVAKTFASLQRQSWKAWVVVDRDRIIELSSKSEGRLVWLNVPAGSVLENNALAHLVRPFSSSDVAIVYSDEDVIDRLGRRHSPMLKPAWSPLLARSLWMPLDGALIDLARVPPESDLRTITVNDVAVSIAPSLSSSIVHLPQVLFSRSQSRPPLPCPRKPTQCLPSLVKVSVIIPTRDRRDLLIDCIDGLQRLTSGVELEIIIVDNDSREKETLDYLNKLVREGTARVIPMPGEFNFARACNLGVGAARHELVLLLNNDVTPITPDWLIQMAQELDDPSVGAVGAYLLYPDGLVQHAGVILGAGSVARHSFSFIHPASSEDRGLLNERRDVSAVTAACLLTTRSQWRSVEGMDEENLPVAFNDVDYCLRLRRDKKRIIWTPFAKLWHHESVSRGKDDTEEKLQRFAREEATMHKRWGHWLRNDPFHNPNLSKVAEDFVLEAFPVSLAARTSNWE